MFDARVDSETLRPFIPRIREHLRREGVPNVLSGLMTLAIEEAVTNVVRHGAGSVRFVCEVSETEVVATLTDSGEPFDPTTCEVRKKEVGGLGVPFMRKIASGLRYERRAGENILTMTFSATKIPM